MSDGVQAQLFAEGLEGANVTRLSYRDELSVPFEVELEVELPTDVTVDPKGWLGRPASVVFSGLGGSTGRTVAGYVARVRERLSRSFMRQRIALTLESPLCPLRLSRDHRIFQELSSKDIVTTVLDEHGVPGDAVVWRLASPPPVREVCTQLDESGLDFVRRVLEEDGIFFFTEHGEAGARIVFGDGPSSYGELAGGPVPCRSGALFAERSSIATLEATNAVRPAKVTLRDHDFTKPALDLTVEEEDDAPLGIEHYDYPGRYVEPSEGARRAKLRLEGFAAAATGLVGTGDVLEMAAGLAFEIEGAPSAAMDGAWVVKRTRLDFDDARSKDAKLEVGFELLPKDRPFRPQLSGARGRVAGPQVARVAGPKGEEIHCDEHGRIKVTYPWDRRSKEDETSSQWVRVAQMHTGGSVAIPRIGWEVVVDYEDGDPDKPIAVGRLYNAIYKPPYPLPASKKMSSLQSMSTPGGGGQNEISADDSAGAEGVSIHAQKDMNVVVANNKTETVTAAEDVGVGSNHTRKVGADETISIGAADSLNVGSSQSWTVGGSRTKTISAGETTSIKGARSLTIGGSHTTITPQSVATTTSGSLTETTGGSAIDIAAQEVGTAIAGAASLSVGGSRISLCGADRADAVVGAKVTNVGGAVIAVAGADATVAAKGVKATNVGGAWMLNAGATCDITANSSLTINVGGAFALTGASVVLKVGGSSVTLAGGQVKLDSAKVELQASALHAELAAMVSDK